MDWLLRDAQFGENICTVCGHTCVMDTAYFPAPEQGMGLFKHNDESWVDMGEFFEKLKETGDYDESHCFESESIEDDDYIYNPSVTHEQEEWINKIWGVSSVDLTVCEICMRGHCGAIDGFNADNWLDEHIEAYKAKHGHAN